MRVYRYYYCPCISGDHGRRAEESGKVQVRRVPCEDEKILEGLENLEVLEDVGNLGDLEQLEGLEYHSEILVSPTGK